MSDKDNKLIALFMGLKQDPHNEYYLIDENKDVGYEHIHESCFLYDSSWDWLMPVLKKIKLQIHPNNMGMWRKVTQPIGYDIHEVHQEAVEFIKRYSNE